MAILTRETTATGVTNNGAPLTNAEVDNNFVELQQNKVNTADLNESVDDRVNTLLQAGLGIDLSYDDVAGELTIDSNHVEVACTNNTGASIPKGTVVYQTGVSGNNITIAPADADDAAKMPAIGLTTDTIADTAEGAIVILGVVNGLDTSAYAAGDTLYVSTTAGALSTTKPTGETGLIQNFGRVLKVNASSGAIAVMGAGRSNAVPNLNDGNVFIGDSLNQSETRALAAGDIQSGTFADARISEDSVTQHESALSITESQISNFGTYLPTSGGTMTGSLTLNADPTVNLQAATKQYVDTLAAASLHYHDPVRVEREGNLTATYDNGTAGVGATLTNADTQAELVIDGVTLSNGDRVLIYEQTNAFENGIYTVTDTGSASTNWVLTRATDADSYSPSDPDSFGQGDAFFVLEGTLGAGELYVMNTSGTITFGTTNITFAQVSSAQVYTAGTGISISGATISSDITLDEVVANGATTSAAITVGSLTSTGDLAVDTDTLFVDVSAGRVGIGTVNPSNNLVVSNGGAEGLEVYTNDPTHGTGFLAYNRSGAAWLSMTFRAGIDGYKWYSSGGVNTMTLTNLGNVGIGETDPAGKLHITSTGNASTITPSTLADELVIENTVACGMSFLSPNFSTQSIFFGDPDDVAAGGIQYDHNVPAMYFREEGSTAMTIKGGNVGIGTTPDTGVNLTVAGSGTAFTRIRSTDAAGDAILQLGNGTDNNQARLAFLGSDRSLNLYTSDQKRVTVDDDGNVGIGTDSPADILTVAGSSTGEVGLTVRNGNGAASGQSAAITFEASAGTTGDVAASVAKIAGVRTGAGSTGDLVLSTTNGGVSSERLRIDASGTVQFKNAIAENQHSLTGTVIDPANGTIQYKTLSANTTFTESLSDGEYVTLMIDDGAGYTITWPTITWVGGSPPTLEATGFNIIELWQVNGTLYGAFVGAA